MIVHDCQEPTGRRIGIAEASDLLGRGGLAVLPTDTVYGIAADAFTPAAVQKLLDAKGRGRNMPPPVLVADVGLLDTLAAEVPQTARELAAAFWPGPLTIILLAQPSLNWDLGETDGTVALRMPNHEVVLELLRRTGPLAVSSANLSGKPSATTVAAAAAAFGPAVGAYLDGGPTPGETPSTIVDLTSPTPLVLREGAIGREQLAQVVPALAEDPAADVPATEVPADEAPAEAAPADEPVGEPDELPAAEESAEHTRGEGNRE
ncbi:L-threonylcarbamoyladenylate synthase [Bogoriella caseilytica]|uniref:L-threonylcarbamoyladenylate synthase n=1 Tax=Bogoriella caseilytica TaxID=56055 RepID=A0A3N2BEW0_9MICO|nr:L-threonylcarbamoyladenylate synthase [Bogoriella caseilytica]ROR73787.1 translation factor SUA5 [Bogoriella caseilytica]